MKEFFWNRVKKVEGDGCWEWQGWCFPQGYGGLSIRVDGKKRTVYAHRVAWELASCFTDLLGPGSDVFICHHCDNPKCVRPSHLYRGTPKSNMQDKVRRGRLVNPVADRNRAKTHCPKGHEYTPENTYVTPGRVGRTCRICTRENHRAKRMALRGRA